MGLCSKCYQEKLKAERAEGKEESNRLERPSFKQTEVRNEDLTKDKVSTENSSSTVSTAPPAKPKRVRCAECNVKVGLCGFKCKCGKVFCGEHRHADGHKCPFDHKKTEREYLARQNPVVQGDKLDRLL